MFKAVRRWWNKPYAIERYNRSGMPVEWVGQYRRFGTALHHARRLGPEYRVISRA